MSREALNPDELFNSLQYGFSQITIGTGSRIVTISGQVGWNSQETMPDTTDLRQQTMDAFKNLDTAIQAAGGTMDNILSLRIYIVDSVMDEAAPIREGLKQFFPNNPPTATWIGVPRLADKAFLVEIEAIAVLG